MYEIMKTMCPPTYQYNGFTKKAISNTAIPSFIIIGLHILYTFLVNNWNALIYPHYVLSANISRLTPLKNDNFRKCSL